MYPAINVDVGDALRLKIVRFALSLSVYLLRPLPATTPLLHTSCSLTDLRAVVRKDVDGKVLFAAIFIDGIDIRIPAVSVEQLQRFLDIDPATGRVRTLSTSAGAPT